jgi:protein involved in temperature-dependent protein secretion
VKSRLLRARLQLRERLGRYFQRRDNENGKKGGTKGENEDVAADVANGDGKQWNALNSFTSWPVIWTAFSTRRPKSS